jgi:hypothetical protein
VELVEQQVERALIARAPAVVDAIVIRAMAEA